MNFRTKVNIGWCGDKISHKHKLLFIGSCFADEIGSAFASGKFRTLVNPFGVLYNPLSIADSLQRIVNETYYSGDELFEYGNLYHSFGHHSLFSDVDKDRMLQNINCSLQMTSQFLRDADYIFLTFGTSWVYELKESGKVVANCHKLPASCFIRRRASVTELSKKMSAAIEAVRLVNPDVKIVFTVSPIRHLKDGVHENALSKSTLLLMCDQLQNEFSDIAYIPSYEILLDELRDYRFYANDMAHPSQLAVEYIWEQIKNEVITPESNTIIKEWDKIRQGVAHRLMSADVEAYGKFLKNLLVQINSFANRYPWLDVAAERCEVEKRIENCM